MNEIEEITITVRKSDILNVLNCFGHDAPNDDEGESYWRIKEIVEHNSQDTHAAACQLAGTNAGAK